MNETWIVQHENRDEDVKFVGVYSSPAKAAKAIRRLKRLPGFKDHPAGFYVDKYTVDLDHWTTGFVSSADSLVGLQTAAAYAWVVPGVQCCRTPGDRTCTVLKVDLQTKKALVKDGGYAVWTNLATMAKSWRPL